MTKLKKTFGLAAMLVAGQLWAQPTTAPTAAPPPATTDVAAPAPAPAQPNLTGAEMASRGAALEQQVRYDTDQVQHLQNIARKEKDVIKLSCVNDKLIRLKAEANVFDAQHNSLNGALDKDERFQYFQPMVDAATGVHTAREEAERCVGEPEVGAESNNTFTKPDVPDDPTTGPFPFGPGETVEPPQFASPFA